MVALAPGLTMLLAFALGLDRISLRRVVGLAVAFTGVAIVVAFGARHDLLALTAATSLVGTVGLTPLVRGSTVDTVADANASDAALLLYLGVLATRVLVVGGIAAAQGMQRPSGLSSVRPWRSARSPSAS